ncbi:MAG TPA: hypothetical protein VGD88_06135 [Opitutaceae bacterium]
MALRTIPLLGFSTPAVKAGHVVLPVLAGGESHNLRMPTAKAREWAQAILAATEPHPAATDGERPLMPRPNGRII